jgi:hypothetical protein
MLLNKVITSRTPSVTQDAQGTDVEDWEGGIPVDSDVRASVQQMSANQTFVFSRRGVDADYEIFTSQQLQCVEGDRITVAGVDDVYYVVKIPCEDMAGRGRWFVTVCKKSTPTPQIIFASPGGP